MYYSVKLTKAFMAEASLQTNFSLPHEDFKSRNISVLDVPKVNSAFSRCAKSEFVKSQMKYRASVGRFLFV